MTAPRTDLASRADVDALLWRFYGQALDDELLAEPFAEVRAKGLSAHIPVMCDFWETVLFRAGLYQRSALQVHREVHERVPLSARHFERWLTLWIATVDQMYQGPVADRAKLQATRIAGAMHRRLTGSNTALTIPDGAAASPPVRYGPRDRESDNRCTAGTGTRSARPTAC